ncbi:MAG: molybdopterin-binding protein [Candidatus Promineifilaceae bacterium]|nr:molybdopterin-binding protein [Candidatus Promineifilaceae bacterium]
MKFGPVRLDEAPGKILGHNIANAAGRRVLRKGHVLTADDVAQLRRLGRSQVYVAELEANDVPEDEAAARLAMVVAGDGLRLSGPTTGRANLYATTTGVLRVDAGCLKRFNQFSGITLATLATNTAVPEGKMVATMKILPYAVPTESVDAAAAAGAVPGGLVRVDTIPARRVALILSGSPTVRQRIVPSFENPLRRRLEYLNASLNTVDFVPLEDEPDEQRLAAVIAHRLAEDSELIVLAGETAIMDRHDIAPRAVEKAGAVITCYGAPVDPGNLLLLAYHGDVPIMGAPGCARSPKANIIDLILPRLLVGERLTATDVIALGHGGLLEDVPERPLPRSQAG